MGSVGAMHLQAGLTRPMVTRGSMFSLPFIYSDGRNTNDTQQVGFKGLSHFLCDPAELWQMFRDSRLRSLC